MIEEQRQRFAVRLMVLAVVLVPLMGVVRRWAEPEAYDPMTFRVAFSGTVGLILALRHHPRVKGWMPALISGMVWVFALRCLVVAWVNGFSIAAVLGLATVQAGIVLTIPTLRQALLLHTFVVAVPVIVGMGQGTDVGDIVRNAVGLVGIAIFGINDLLLRTEAEVALRSRTEALEQMADELEARVAERTEALAHEVTVRTDAERRARAASDAKSQFLANMSHELRTPLNAIQGYAEIVLDDLDDDALPARDDVERIHRSGEHLLAMIDEVLDLARVEQGRLDLRYARVALDDVVRQAVDTVAPLLSVAGCEVHVEVQPFDATVVTDRQRLVQVLVNLLGNAAKFAPGQPVSVRASVDGHGVKLAVRDRGPGIEEEDLARVFDSFTQLDPSSTRRAGGTGLGLAISEQLARALGGRLEVDSEPGEGATFTLMLPLRPPTQPSATPSGT